MDGIQYAISVKLGNETMYLDKENHQLGSLSGATLFKSESSAKRSLSSTKTKFIINRCKGNPNLWGDPDECSIVEIRLTLK